MRRKVSPLSQSDEPPFWKNVPEMLQYWHPMGVALLYILLTSVNKGNTLDWFKASADLHSALVSLSEHPNRASLGCSLMLWRLHLCVHFSLSDPFSHSGVCMVRTIASLSSVTY